MRTTLALDDDLLAKAQALTGLKENRASSGRPSKPLSSAKVAADLRAWRHRTRSSVSSKEIAGLPVTLVDSSRVGRSTANC